MILLFVGAGGAAAVGNGKFPTTKKFLEELDSDIKEDEWFKLIHEFCEERSNGSPVDIEEVLEEMEKELVYLEQTHNRKEFQGWIWDDRTRFSKVNGGSTYSSFPDGVSHAQSSLKKIRDKIRKIMHEVYGIDSGIEFYKTNRWHDFIDRLLNLNSLPVEIFTTNYDKIFEGTIDEGSHIYSGWEKRVGPKMILDITSWNRQLRSGPKGRFTKLHGSINWVDFDGEIQAVNGKVSPESRIILYPGSKGGGRSSIPSPFDKFYDHLESVVSGADIFIFVGFAFRGPDINEILSEGIGHNDQSDRSPVRKVIIDLDCEDSPGMPKDTPKELRDAKYFGQSGFSEEAVEKCIQYLAL